MKPGWKYLGLTVAFLALMQGEVSTENSPRPCEYFLREPYFESNPYAPKSVRYYDGGENLKKKNLIANLVSKDDNGIYDILLIDEDKGQGCLGCHRPNAIASELEGV
jgi:hypothetical protein